MEEESRETFAQNTSPTPDPGSFEKRFPLVSKYADSRKKKCFILEDVSIQPFVFEDLLPPRVKVQSLSLVNFLQLLTQHRHSVLIEAHQENLGSKLLEESDKGF